MSEIVQSLVVAGFIGLVGFSGYQIGYGKAEAEGQAVVNALKVEQSERDRRAAEAYGKALADRLADYQDEVARGKALETKLRAQEKQYAADARKLKKRIANATKNAACTLEPDVVRVLNEAAGVDLPEHPLPGAACPASPSGGVGNCTAPDGRVLGPYSGVSQADLAAWFVDYARRCRGMENRLSGWRQWYQGRKGVTP